MGFRVKFQAKFVTEGSRLVAILGNLVKSIELEAEDLDVDSITLRFNGRDELDVESLVSSDTLDVDVSGANWVSGYELTLEDLMVRVLVKPARLRGGVKLRSVYELVPEVALRFDNSLLTNLSKRTTLDGVEYIALYTSKGFIVVLEGDVHRVTIPYVEALGVIHTHPEGACGFSEADVRSTAYALADLTLFEAIVTPTCAFYIARVGFVDEVDFETLLNNRGGIVEPVNLATVKMRKLRL